jgi:hypothetical protein
VREVLVPSGSLLARYRDAFADAYCADVSRAVSFESFVETFYTSWLFRLERFVLALVGRASTDAQARELAQGLRTRFAAWSVEDRDAQQLLLADDTARTRSWLMCEALEVGATRLYFGSAVVPRADPRGRRRMGLAFNALLRFHRLYSRALLSVARRRLEACAPSR